MTDENEKLKDAQNSLVRANRILGDEKKDMGDRISHLNKELNNKNYENQRKNRRFGDSGTNNTGGNNLLYNNMLNSENYNLRDLLEKYKQIISVLLRFVNDLNSLFSHPELSLSTCVTDTNILNDNLNTLREDIRSLLEEKESGNDPQNRDKWDKLQEKLTDNKSKFYNVNNMNNINLNSKAKNKKLEVENEPKYGKCWACNIGRSTSLKGASPYLCQKHKFYENY